MICGMNLISQIKACGSAAEKSKTNLTIQPNFTPPAKYRSNIHDQEREADRMGS